MVYIYETYTLSSPSVLHGMFLTPLWLRRRWARGHVRQADRQRDMRCWPQAALHYRDALHYVPRRHDLWVQYGHALKESGLLTDAELAYRNALQIKPDCADTHLQMGHVLKLQNRRDEARKAYLKAHELAPHLPGLSSEL